MGIATDLAALMKQLSENFLDKDKRRYYLQVHGWLDQIESQIKDRGQRQRLDEAADDREDRASLTRAPTLFPGARAGYESLHLGRIAQDGWRRAQLDTVAEDSWKKYAEKIVQEERNTWLARFEQDSKEFDQTYIYRWQRRMSAG